MTAMWPGRKPRSVPCQLRRHEVAKGLIGARVGSELDLGLLARRRLPRYAGIAPRPASARTLMLLGGRCIHGRVVGRIGAYLRGRLRLGGTGCLRGAGLLDGR